MGLCENCKITMCGYESDDVISCGDFMAKEETNADRIRAMSDEELAEHLIQYRDDWGDYCTPNCEFYDTYEEAKKATIKWLKQPAEGE